MANTIGFRVNNVVVYIKDAVARLMGLPAGGSAGQILKKNSAADYDAAWANESSYSLPNASANTLGGVKVGTNLSIDANGVLSATDTTYNDATSSASGLMSSTDKSKLDGIDSGANAYVLPSATASVLGGVKIQISTTDLSDGISQLESGKIYLYYEA